MNGSLMMYAKAILAALIAGLSALSAALVDDGGLTGAQLVSILSAALVGGSVVWAVPNKPPVSAPILGGLLGEE